jgi:hypothetical protein
MRDIEIDKMEAYAFINQLAGLDEHILLERMIKLFETMQFNKKLYLKKRTVKQ